MSSATPLLSSATAQGASDAPSQSVVLPTLQQKVEQCVDAQLGLHEPTWEAFDDLLVKYNLRSKETGAAGNCQYCVVAHVLEQNGVSKPFGTIRQEVATELTTHPERYADFVSVEDGQDAQTEYSKLVERTKTEGEWGDHVTLQASCNAYGLSLLMFCSDGRTVDLQPTTTQTMHGNIAYLTGLHYRGTERLDAASAVIVPKDAVSLAAFLKVVLKDVGKRVLWEADEADETQITHTTSALLKFLKYFHNQLRNKSLTGPNALHDVTQLLGAFLLSRNTHFQKRVQDRIDASCKDREDKGKDSQKTRAQWNTFRDKLFDFGQLTNSDDIFGDWEAIMYKFLHPLEPDVYKKKGTLLCDDPNTVRDIIREMVNTLMNVDFEHNIGDHLGVLYEHFTNTYMRTSKDFGQYFTPHKLVRAIVALLPKDMHLPDDVSVYDPSMGTGCFLTSFANTLQKTHPEKRVHIQGRELQKLTYSLARMALSMCCKDAPTTTQCTNTLISMDWNTQHDVVLSNPPFALKQKYAIRTKNSVLDFHKDASSRMLDYCKEFYDSTNSEEKYASVENPKNKPTSQLCLEDGEQEFYTMYPFNCSQDATLGMFVTHCVKKTKVGGYGAIIVPVGTRLCSGTEKGALALRKWMVDETDVFQIMEVPKGVFETAGVSTVVLFYKRGSPTKDTRFIRINPECTRVEELFTVSRADMDERNWQFEAGVYREEEESKAHYGIPMVALGDVCDIQYGDGKIKELSTGIHPLIGGGIKPARFVNKFNQQEDTIVVSRSGSAGYVQKLTGPSFVTSYGFVVKCKTNAIRNGYLYYAMKMKQDCIIALQAGAATQNLNRNALRNYKIPLPPLHIQRQIVDDITPLDTLRTHLQTVIDTHKHRQKMYLRSMLRLHGGSCGKVALGDVCMIRYGTRIVKKNTTVGKIPVYGGGGQTFTTTAPNRTGKSLVISRFGVSPHCVRVLDGPLFLNDSGMTLHTKNNQVLNFNFLCHVISSLETNVFALASGAAQANLNVDSFKTLQIPLPPLDLQTQWAAYLQTIQTSIDDCTHALANLEQERNDILQSYLTAPPAPSTEPQCDAAPNTTDGAAPPTHPNTATGEGGTPEHASFTPTTPAETKAVAYLTKHNLAHIVDWQARTIQGVPFSTLHTLTDFRKGDGRAFRQKLKEVDTKKLKKVVELLGKCV